MASKASKGMGFLRLRWMAVGLLAAAIGLPWLGLAKIWTRTPEGFVPSVRVSLLDLAQAWSLKRSAERHVEKGEMDQALDCWRLAFANNPADIGVLRRWLRALVRDESLVAGRRESMQGSVGWLLSLGGTNSADLDLSLGVMERMGDVKQVLAIGRQWKSRLGTAGKGWMARAHFDEGDVSNFDLAWQGNAEAFEKDPELALYRDAWRAHWGPVSTLREGRARLDAAMSRPELRRLALRLGMHVAYAREDAREYGRLLGILSAEGPTEASYHVSYWSLLAGNGQRESARKLAEGGLVEPMTLVDVQGLAKVLVALDLGPRALSMLEVNRARFRQHTAFWLVEARCLLELKKWKELEDLGRAFRGDPSVDAANIGVGWGIEAVGAHGRGRAEEARELGRKMLLGVPKSPEVCGALAMLLTEARLDHLALATIRLLEPHGMDDPGYWRQRTLVASQTLDSFELVRCSTERFALEPNDILARNMHAAVLLMARQNAPEAVRLTFQNMALLPMNPDVRLNHAMALAFNSRASEAAVVLEGTPVRSLSAPQRNHYHLAWFDVHVARQEWGKARDRARLMDQGLLLPLQRQRVQEDLGRAPR